MRLKADDIAFWILILATIAVILWLLRGSPTLENGVITIGLFLVSMIILLYKKYFEIDKNTTISFMKVKNEFMEVKNRLGTIDNKLSNLGNLIKSKK